MREIKFRAWDGIRITTSGIMFNCSTSTLEVPEGSQMKLMQYTGLKDKNGKEIYEGDIDGSCKEALMYVVFEQGQFGLKFSDENNYFDNCVDWKNIEIIGNIYENPELLTKGGKNE